MAHSFGRRGFGDRLAAKSGELPLSIERPPLADLLVAIERGRLPAAFRQYVARLVKHDARCRQTRALVARRNAREYGARVRALVRVQIGALAFEPGLPIKPRVRRVLSRIRCARRVVNAATGEAITGPAACGFKREPSWKVIAEELRAMDAEMTKRGKAEPERARGSANVEALPAAQAA